MDKPDNGQTNNNPEKEQALTKKKHLYIIVSALSVVITFLLIFWIYFIYRSSENKFSGLIKVSPDLSGKIENQEDKNSNTARRLIDGMMVEKGNENLFPLAVMIDNHVDARPPSALSRAQIVFECEAEGGITRYLAVFAANENMEKIGPVRSARSYFIDWAREFSSLFVHVGGSPEALVKLKKENIPHINEFYNENYFWRSAQRNSPHNVYTSFALLGKYLNDHGLVQGDYFSWQFKEDAPRISPDKNFSIKISFLLPDYIVEWKYDDQSNSFTRYLDSSIHKTVENEEIIAKNIVIQYVDSTVIDDELRLEVHNIGSGDALFCLDGGCAGAYWQKKNSYARTRFYEKNPANGEIGVELKFNPGTTWIEAINPEIEVEY